MRAYFIKRLLAIIPTLIFATLIVFFLVRLVPGDIIDLMVSQHDVSEVEVTRKTLEKALGLDVPIYVQYYRWMKAIILHGDLGGLKILSLGRRVGGNKAAGCQRRYFRYCFRIY